MIEKYKNNYSSISFFLALLFIITPIIISIYNSIFGDKSYTFWYVYIVNIGMLSLMNGLLGYKLKYKKIDKVIILFLLALLLSFIAMLVSGNILRSFIGSQLRHSAFLTYVCFLGFFLNTILINKDDYKKIVNVFIIITVLMCIISLLQNTITFKLFYYNSYPNTAKVNYPYNAIYYNANHFGYYLSFAVLIIIFMLFNSSGWKKLLYLLSYSICTYTLIVNNTFGAYLGVLLMLPLVGIFAIKDKKKMDYLIVLTIFIICSVFITYHGFYVVKNNFQELFGSSGTSNVKVLYDDAGRGRVGIWKKYIGYIKESPIVGYGGENTANKFLEEHISPRSPHNSIIEIAAYNGIPCLLLYLAGLIIMFIRYFKRKKFDLKTTGVFLAVGAYFISSMFGNMTYYISPYLVILLGLLFNLEKGEENEKSS